MVEHVRSEIMCLDTKRAELFEDLEGEAADEEEATGSPRCRGFSPSPTTMRLAPTVLGDEHLQRQVALLFMYVVKLVYRNVLGPLISMLW